MSVGSERLAQDLGVEALSGPARALAEEAVRVKARLDQLDGWIRGTHKSWFVLGERLGQDVELVINAPLGEARQQALALRAILESLAKMASAEPVAPPASRTDEIAAQREARRAAISQVAGAESSS